ncbi:hypothetical protein F7725_018738 [Dissostichus mawsoni]|uniref:Uncharacterized protein n=1 Tax=Dissostichus mawsoni TaxID=36200 RepID=A0A7J5XT15_DISMA|nr:hypothetical protein F7725_018738 [Dissostichus mawsoni]
MPAAIFVTDSDSLFTIVMAANIAHLNGTERERGIFGKDDAYQYVVAGWVNDTKIWHNEEDTPTCQSFPGFEQQTNISMDCGAGGRDSGDGTFYMYGRVGRVVAAVEKRENQTCTEKPCTWTQPTTKIVKYDEVSNIFAIKEQVQTEDLFQHMRPSADDFKLFCEQLHQSEEQETKPEKSAILSVIEGHSHRYTAKTVQLDLPTPLTVSKHQTCTGFACTARGGWGLQNEDTAKKS